MVAAQHPLVGLSQVRRRVGATDQGVDDNPLALDVRVQADPAPVVALVMRTRRPFFRSRPGNLLLWSTVTLIAGALAVPYLPFMRVFGFVPLPAGLIVTIATITIAYVAATELQKKWFYAGARW